MAVTQTINGKTYSYSNDGSRVTVRDSSGRNVGTYDTRSGSGIAGSSGNLSSASGGSVSASGGSSSSHDRGSSYSLSNGNTRVYNNGPSGWTEYDSRGNAVAYGTAEGSSTGGTVVSRNDTPQAPVVPPVSPIVAQPTITDQIYTQMQQQWQQQMQQLQSQIDAQNAQAQQAAQQAQAAAQAQANQDLYNQSNKNALNNTAQDTSSYNTDPQSLNTFIPSSQIGRRNPRLLNNSGGAMIKNSSGKRAAVSRYLARDIWSGN